MATAGDSGLAELITGTYGCLLLTTKEFPSVAEGEGTTY